MGVGLSAWRHWFSMKAHDTKIVFLAVAIESFLCYTEYMKILKGVTAMGRFIITRTAADVRFLLESAGGMALAFSRSYKNLDACKKGIASLAANLPTAPLVDGTAGERAPNPKIELVASGTGYAFLVKAPNGKIVISSPAYATKKAARRAVSMLRTAVSDATLVLSCEAGFTRLKMRQPPLRSVAAEGAAPAMPARMASVTEEAAPFTSAVSFTDEPDMPDDALVTAEGSPAPVAEEPALQASPPPRFMRVGEISGRAGAAPRASAVREGSSSETGRSALLARILRRK